MYALKCALKITIDGAVKSHYDTNVCHSRESESIISDTYKFLDSRFRGNDNYLRSHHH